MGFRIAWTEPGQADELAVCHLAAFPVETFTDEAITLLGRGFLRAHHRFYATQPDGICLIAVEQATGRVAGFVLGGDPLLRKRFVRRRCLRFAATVAFKAFVSPPVRRRVAMGLHVIARRLHLLPASAALPDPPSPSADPWAILLFLCTHPDFRGRGLGQALADAFWRESTRRGYRMVRLTTGLDNRPAKSLYSKCGWNEVGQVQQIVYMDRLVSG